MVEYYAPWIETYSVVLNEQVVRVYLGPWQKFKLKGALREKRLVVSGEVAVINGR